MRVLIGDPRYAALPYWVAIRIVPCLSVCLTVCLTVCLCRVSSVSAPNCRTRSYRKTNIQMTIAHREVTRSHECVTASENFESCRLRCGCVPCSQSSASTIALSAILNLKSKADVRFYMAAILKIVMTS